LIELLVETQVYVGFQGAKKFIQFLDSTLSSGITAWETNLYVALQGTAVLILPPLAFASFFKLGKHPPSHRLEYVPQLSSLLISGNLANDGFRLGRRLDLELDLDVPRSKSRDPLVTSGSACGAAWRHCPPLAPSLHAISALCSLVAKVVLEARLIKEGGNNRGTHAS